MEHPTSPLNSQITDASSLIVAKAAHSDTTLYRNPKPEVSAESKWVYLGVGLGTGVVIGAAIYYFLSQKKYSPGGSKYSGSLGGTPQPGTPVRGIQPKILSPLWDQDSVIIKLDPVIVTPRFNAIENSSHRRGINSPPQDPFDSFIAEQTPTLDLPALNLEKFPRKWKMDDSPEPSQSRSPDPDSFLRKSPKKLTTEKIQKSDFPIKKSSRESLIKIPSRMAQSPRVERATSHRKAYSAYPSNSDIMTLHPKFDDHESEIVSIGTSFKKGESQPNLDRWSR